MKLSQIDTFHSSSSCPSIKNHKATGSDIFIKVSSFAKAIFFSVAIFFMVASLSLVFEMVFPNIAGMYVAFTAALLALVGGVLLFSGVRTLSGTFSKVCSKSAGAVEEEMKELKSQLLEVIDSKKSLCDGSLVKFPELDAELLKPLIFAQNQYQAEAKKPIFSKKTRSLWQELTDSSSSSTGAELFIDGCTQILKRGKFLKDKREIETLSDEEKLRLTFPYFASQHLKDEELIFSTYSELSLWDSSIEFCKRERKLLGDSAFREVFPSRDFRRIFVYRFSREFFFLMLGCFSSSEIKEIARTVSCSLSAKHSHLMIYANLVKKYPRLVAVEAMFLNWLHEVYPYMLSAQIFDHYQKFFCEALEESSKFLEGKAPWSFLEHFSGILPAVMALFCKSKGEEYCCQGWSWSFFCQKATEYARKASLIPGFAGNLSKFHEYVDGGDEIFSKAHSLVLKYTRSTCRFDRKPFALWNMRSLYQEDPLLEAKLREGLRYLKEVEFIGGELFSLIHLEITALGLDQGDSASDIW
ncbi:hypothetical protein [Chlamydiifrater phoenicopteri]|uniref:hypothetical protein n=1 Tax=Chlamydiifrater phoenicopteri TaxID=2681469 RepID=UPI001BCF5801|nr:hypothetical protein [Chlamydiifrater phoenicopteri]